MNPLWYKDPMFSRYEIFYRSNMKTLPFAIAKRRILCMEVSGKKVAEAILQKLAKEIQRKNLNPTLAIILANNNPSSRIYVRSKIITAKRVGINAKLFEFSEDEQDKVLKKVDRLNKDSNVDGMIIQYPVYKGWNFDQLASKIDHQKDLDGFLENSPFNGATALGVWEMLTAFALEEGFKKTADFLKGKKIVLIGKGKAAGGPTFKLLVKKGFPPEVVEKNTLNPSSIIKKADVIISATGVKNIINGSNVKKGSYVIGVGVGKEIINGQSKIYGDINEEEISKKARLYCPTIGGIGPLTIACLLRNVVQSAHGLNG